MKFPRSRLRKLSFSKRSEMILIYAALFGGGTVGFDRARAGVTVRHNVA